MKLIDVYIIFFYLLFITNLVGFERKNDWQLNVGNTIEGEFKSSSKMFFPLDEGEWTLVVKEKDTTYFSISIEELTFVQINDRTPTKIFSIGRVTNLGKYLNEISSIITNEVFNNKYGYCVKKQHINFLNYYKKGIAHNCMVANYLDVQRELFPSDFDEDRIYSASIRKWVRENNIKLPDIYLNYTGSFHAMNVRDAWYVIEFLQTPESFAKYKPKFTTRDTSEFHPDNINNFPNANKIMKDWIKKSSSIHRDFEKFQTVRKRHKLNLGEFKRAPSKKIKQQTDIVNSLVKLDALYKAGALTKEEYIKAKKKLLDQ